MTAGAALLMVALVSARADTAAARRHYESALDRLAHMDERGALTELRAAVRADAEYFPAHRRIDEILLQRGDPQTLRREYAAVRSSPVRLCMQAITQAPASYRVQAFAKLQELERRFGPNACTAYYSAMIALALTPQQQYRDEVFRLAARATVYAPAIHDGWMRYARMLQQRGRDRDAERALRTALSLQRHPLNRLELVALLRAHEQATGDAASERALSATLAAAANDTRPLVRILGWDIWHQPDERRYALVRAAARLARARGAWSYEWLPLITLGNRQLDRGNVSGALADLQRAVTIVAGEPAPQLQMLAYRLRGRAYSKLGDLGSAERDLLRAIALGQSVGDPWELAESYHNLAHVYESAGRLRAAARAADRFVALTQPLTHAQPRVMSLRDAGLIRWKAGWHAAANDAFEKMVRAVESQQSNYYWAGEHLERSGDYDDALRYYRLGVASGQDLALNWSGLARVFESLGQLDSAEVAARKHDRVIADQATVPLLPKLLLTRGRADTALVMAQRWAERRVREGNISGAASAYNQLAQLSLDAGRFQAALAATRRAREFADRLHLVDQRAVARRIEGATLVRVGDVPHGIAMLAQLSSGPDASGGARERFALEVAYGDALAYAKQTRAALRAYERAAATVDRTTSALAEDAARARYRGVQLAPFDRALHLLLRTSPHDLQSITAWSQRRKAAALVFATGTRPGSADVLSLRAVQQRLEPGETMIDYIITDSVQAALVLTRATARLVRLPASSAQITAYVERLRAPLLSVYGGQIDLPRVPYDLPAAYQLYRAVVAPALEGVAETTLITFAPDAALHAAVFDALLTQAPGPTTSYRTASYLIDRVATRLVPSMQFAGRSAISWRGRRVLAVARDAPGVAAEVRGIRAALTSLVDYLADGQATEERLQHERQRYTILHLAAHAQADDRDPGASHLRLTSSKLNDGYWHLSEIAAVPASADLVVLSACQTMSGKVYPGEGLMGLSRAFLASGTRNVVATTWAIGPSSAQLMQVFYTQVEQGRNTAAALRSAKLALRRDATTAHPFYWASFVLVTRGSR